MGFIERIRKIFKNSPNRKKEKNTANRIGGLNIANRIGGILSKCGRLDNKLREVENEIINIAWYRLEPKMCSRKKVEFNPKEIEIRLTMEKLHEGRIKRREHILKNKREHVRKNFALIQDHIGKEDVNQAFAILNNTNNLLQELTNKQDEELKVKFLALKLEAEKLNIKLIARQKEKEIIQKEKEAQEIREREKRIKREKKESEKTEFPNKERKSIRPDNAYKSDGTKILEYLRENGITCFYHFTAERNLESIRKEGGLYSWDHCLSKSIVIPIAGGDETSQLQQYNINLTEYQQDFIVRVY